MYTSYIKKKIYIHVLIIALLDNKEIYLNIESKTDLMCFLVGGFAFVYEAQDLGSGKDYALKVKCIYFSTGLQSLSFYFSLTVNP